MIRRAYVKRIETKMRDWEEEIDRLKARAERAEKDLKAVYREQLEPLRSRERAVLGRLKELRDARSDDWGRFKKGVEEAMVDMKKAADDAIEKLRKIA